MELTQQFRADADFANACAKYHDLLEQKKHDEAKVLLAKFILRSGVNHRTEFNIVKTNLCRAYINDRMMNERKPPNCPTVEPIDNPESQTMYLYIGLPLISNFNNDKLNSSTASIL